MVTQKILYTPLREGEEGIKMKLFYVDGEKKLFVTEVLTNHSMSVDDMLEYVDMDEWAAEQGFDGWDWEALELEP